MDDMLVFLKNFFSDPGNYFYLALAIFLSLAVIFLINESGVFSQDFSVGMPQRKSVFSRLRNRIGNLIKKNPD